jgi:hypothetical protein
MAARSLKANDVRAPEANRELREVAVQATFSESVPADASDSRKFLAMRTRVSFVR